MEIPPENAAVPVQHAGSGDGDVLGILGRKQGCIHGYSLAFKRPEMQRRTAVKVRQYSRQDGIAVTLLGSQQQGPLGEIQMDMAFQYQGQGAVDARREIKTTALWQEGNRGLNGGSVVLHAIPGRAEAAHIQGAAFLRRPEARFLRPAGSKTDFHSVITAGPQPEQGENVGR